MKYIELDDAKERVTAIFGAPQSVEWWPNFAEVEDDDPRFLKYCADNAIDPLDWNY
jgi:hypothetical protein